ncbi:protein root UVB sensitive 2, chloroplastic-like isoform X2 [Syzygium oleosum]|uniref:protein root UVB sensitive 2, chloroplastic-like isoform X2 n=1 Tax=Syzygium oleosum TaxID=219896 RepID=UPI0024B8E25A|nr:protein root UVB sensitive 2, chloroplastic-like isoform X2 [Syzygium oleosum]
MLAKSLLLAGPLLSAIHIYSVTEEMRATPVNTLNPQRTALIVANFLKTGKVLSPADIRYREDLLFPGRLIEEAGNVKVGRALHDVFRPSKINEWKEKLPEEKFLLSRGSKWIDMVLEHNATGEDALRGWLVAAYVRCMEKSNHEMNARVLQDAYMKMSDTFSPFVAEVQAKGWHADQFLDEREVDFHGSIIVVLMIYVFFRITSPSLLLQKLMKRMIRSLELLCSHVLLTNLVERSKIRNGCALNSVFIGLRRPKDQGKFVWTQ